MRKPMSQGGLWKKKKIEIVKKSHYELAGTEFKKS